MDILFLTRDLPYPPTDGWKIRVFSLIQQLSRRHRVSLVSFMRTTENPDDVHGLEPYCEQIRVVPRVHWYSPWKVLLGLVGPNALPIVAYQDRQMLDTLKSITKGRKFDIVQAESLHMAQYALGLPAPAVLDLHNIESTLMKRAADTQKEPFTRGYMGLTGRKLATYERGVCRRFAFCLTCSEEDRRELASEAGVERIAVIPNGVDLQSYASEGVLNPPAGAESPARLRQGFGGSAEAGKHESQRRRKGEPEPSAPGSSRARSEGALSGKTWGPAAMEEDQPRQANRLVFVGRMDYRPNVDAVRWFSREVLPRIREQIPNAVFQIVGGHPTKAVERLAARNRIEVTGFVEDVRPYLKEATAVVVPLRAGGGTRLKILEALAMGKAVVSTSVGAEGIEAVPQRDLLIGDDPEAFASQVVRVIEDKNLRRSLGQAGRKLTEEKYGWDSIARDLERVYENCGDLATRSSERASLIERMAEANA